MELITVRELFKNTEKYVDKEIEIGGWVRNKRPSKQFGFIVLNGGKVSTVIQDDEAKLLGRALVAHPAADLDFLVDVLFGVLEQFTNGDQFHGKYLSSLLKF